MRDPKIKDEDYWQLSKFTIEKAAVGIFWVDSDVCIRRANEAAAKTLGYSQEELESLQLEKVGVEYHKYIGSEQFWDTLRLEKSVRGETSLYRKNGEIFPAECIAQYIKFKEREFVCLFFLDISKRKQIEAELMQALDEVESLKTRLLKEKEYLEEEIKIEHNFEEIIGSSSSLKSVLKKLEQVAPTDATVLIHGETGTGKELLARAIHGLSHRNTFPLIKVNCAALPASLIESELFGHEKGSFTGALNAKSGRFELAHNGTIFLDEIGDLSIDVQVKLLRVLQEGEFERLGGVKTLKVDVRVIGATNRDLVKLIELGKFREDLYYRLNVFPVTSPPVRDRIEDIPILVYHFLKKFSTRIGKPVDRISHSTMDSLKNYSWPGNVRELQNIIERAVILSQSSWLELDSTFDLNLDREESYKLETIAEHERQHIIRVLDKTNWRVSGEKGAAKVLGLKAQTLFSKMRKHNLKRL